VLKQEICKEQWIIDSEGLKCVADVVTFYEQKKHEQHVAYFNVCQDVIFPPHLIKPKDVDNRAS
jgi:hypothetical protein